jgi:hypothetical protein
VTTTAVALSTVNQPPIPLLDPDTGKKVKLKLRHMSFARELDSLPSELLKIHQLLIESRASLNQNTYLMVAAWNKLRIYDHYWTSFKFGSEDEYLAYYGLADGTTLAGWTIMVSLFDRSTFVLLGDEVLSFMMRSVGEYQPDTDERKKDYQKIFDLYCAMRDSFDKSTFYRTVRDYVLQKYEKALASEAGLPVEKWQQQRSIQSKGSRKRRQVVAAASKQTFGPHLASDFVWQSEVCSYCVAKAEAIKLFQEYVGELEKIVSTKLGRRYLPKKPEKIKSI